MKALKKMRLYSFYTPSHKILKDKWFLPSIKDDFDVILEEYSQECPTGAFMTEGWIDCMIRKVDLIIRAIKENEGEIFVHSDVDIQFFRPIKSTIERLIKNKDMIIQRESRSGTVCPGFFAARGNEKNHKIWTDIRESLKSQSKKHDQDLLNEFLGLSKKNICNRSFLHRILVQIRKKSNLPLYSSDLPNKYCLKWGYLPLKFYSPGISISKLWKPGDERMIPNEIVLHHANWCIGLENKIAQLEYVKKKVEQGK